MHFSPTFGIRLMRHAAVATLIVGLLAMAPTPASASMDEVEPYTAPVSAVKTPKDVALRCGGYWMALIYMEKLLAGGIREDFMARLPYDPREDSTRMALVSLAGWIAFPNGDVNKQAQRAASMEDSDVEDRLAASVPAMEQSAKRYIVTLKREADDSVSALDQVMMEADREICSGMAIAAGLAFDRPLDLTEAVDGIRAGAE